jgi:hypothetical protein
MNINRKWMALGVLGLALALAPNASAQTTGTVAISGTVNRAAKLTSGGAATLAGNVGGGVTTGSAADAALATVVDLGDVGPANTNAIVCFVQPLFLRANGSSTLSAAVTAESFTAGPSNVAKTDLGIGFTGLTDFGSANADISTSTVAAGYATDVCAAPFTRTLNDLATATPGTTIMSSTGPLSLRGSFSSPANRVGLDMRLAIAPGAYAAPDTFSATVTLTLTSP